MQKTLRESQLVKSETAVQNKMFVKCKVQRFIHYVILQIDSLGFVQYTVQRLIKKYMTL